MLDDTTLLARGLESSAVVAVITMAGWLIKWLTGDYLVSLKQNTEAQTKVAVELVQLKQEIHDIDEKVNGCMLRRPENEASRK